MMPFKEWIDLQYRWGIIGIAKKKKILKDAGYSPNLASKPLATLPTQMKYDIYYILRKQDNG